ncbi:MAG: hypothetical protein QM805_07730 [Pseudomonas sp.]
MADLVVEGTSPQDLANNPDVVLNSAMGHFERVLVLGYNKKGEIDAFGSLNFPNEMLVFAMERLKHKIMAGDYGRPEDLL